jgi:3-phosphoshikimate 1-carboxyvinyltransferase
MIDALTALGVAVRINAAKRVCDVTGVGGGFPIHAGRLFLGNAGTAFRPLTAVLAVLGGTYELSGVPRMHERPIGDLVDALRALGCDVRYLGREGFRRWQLARRAHQPASVAVVAMSPASSCPRY